MRYNAAWEKRSVYLGYENLVFGGRFTEIYTNEQDTHIVHIATRYVFMREHHVILVDIARPRWYNHKAPRNKMNFRSLCYLGFSLLS